MSINSRYILLIIIAFASLSACADSSSSKKGLIPLIHTISNKPPKDLKEIEKKFGFIFQSKVDKPYLPNGTKKVSDNPFFLYANYEKTGLLSLYLKKNICVSRKSIIDSFGIDFDFYIPISHNFSSDKSAAPFQGILETITYQQTFTELSFSFPVDEKTGLSEDNSCLSEVVLDMSIIKHE